ncbi:MAG: DNA-deoxyinosine glycosylase [Dokdonella sp.]|uniref:DNA-deoxyinosine glycosylase n=1 Tax=Dokdonella sp. TaxID=2291710 RepID=UPI0025C547A3|nr:DNA-deoxyinosine glycosylase [Dokdonella sp.]MBZ0222001.1 DNA-deoxyinosine glycosylase [Dokdonella sp.]MCC7255916.1 DNA-deoxyinosine glycosylase [Dokdonella sp.]
MGSNKASTEATASRVESFPPQVGACCRVLILGSVPSRRSLELRQSYGHAQNLFWPFMGELFNAGPELAYAQRIARLHASGIGIWDVLERCERRGSLDGDILRASEVPNDIPGLLERHPETSVIALNGSKAAEVFRRRIAPHIDAQRTSALQILALPSTSPANASIPRARKLESWRVLREWSLPDA